MNLPRFAVTHRPIILSLVLIAFTAGLFNLATMSRREDPEITIRDALVTTAWPGAPAERVDDLLTDPIEKAIAEIAEIETIESESMTGLSIIQLALDDDAYEIDQVWDDVRAKIEAIESDLPDGAARPDVNSDFGDVFQIAFALYQTSPDQSAEPAAPYTPRQLEVFAEEVEDALELIPEVGKVSFWGVRPERIYVEIASADLAKLDVTATELRDTFQARNILTPGGELESARARYTVTPTGEFSDLDQMRNLVIDRRDGVVPIRLGDLPVTIDRRYEEPVRSLARLSTPDAPHRAAVVIGVSMKSGRNIAVMSDAVDAAIAQLQSGVLPADVALERVNDLPRQVVTRITDFQVNLLQGVAIVLLVAFLMMGWRPAVIMAMAVPLSMLTAIALVRPIGVELEQFAIASLIIALGLVVDNAVVISDNVVRKIGEGDDLETAAIDGAQDLAVPIFTATLTTMFAFLPMLTISGNSGEYISSLPIVVAATLGASYLLAMTVTPITSIWLLKRPQTTADASGETAAPSRAGRIYDRVIGWAIARPGIVLSLTGLVFVASLGIVPIIGNQFFPEGDRDQFFVKVYLPEGSPIGATERVVERIEGEILDLAVAPDGRARLANVVSFVGSGGPRLMLTQEPERDYPHYALLLVNTTDPTLTNDYLEALSARLAPYPEARILVERFVLGPPIADPIAFRLSGPDPDVLRAAGREMVEILKQTPGARQVYDDWGRYGFQVDVQIDNDAAVLAGVTNSDIALTTQALLSGTALTRFREGDHLVPVVLRTPRGQREELSDLEGVFVSGARGKVPLDAVAELSASRQPATIQRRDRIPTITIGARPEPGLLANDVAAAVLPAFEALAADLGPQYRLEQGGEFEETVKTQGQVLTAMGIAIGMIFLILIAQYNQVLKPIIILLTIPLALIGVLIGLLATGWALGFMANLGVLALAGIVINNAIVLIDFIETRVAAGVPLRAAVAESGRQRMRPITLTTLTTIGGLLPLSLFGGPLWAAMTNGMIFGLLFGTVLTLVVVPVLYVAFAERLGMRVV